jgi:hypothetical protein
MSYYYRYKILCSESTEGEDKIKDCKYIQRKVTVSKYCSVHFCIVFFIFLFRVIG